MPFYLIDRRAFLYLYPFILNKNRIFATDKEKHKLDLRKTSKNLVQKWKKEL